MAEAGFKFGHVAPEIMFLPVTLNILFKDAPVNKVQNSPRGQQGLRYILLSIPSQPTLLLAFLKFRAKTGLFLSLSLFLFFNIPKLLPVSGPLHVLFLLYLEWGLLSPLFT